MKKVFSVLLSLLILCSVLTEAMPATADDTTRIYSGFTESANAGQSVKIPVCISGNTGLMGFRLDFDFDDDTVTPVSVEYGDVITSGIQDNIDSRTDTDSFKVYWSGSNSVSTDGVLFYVNFNVSATASGSTSINMSYSQEDTFNESFEDVILTCETVNLDIVNNIYSQYAKLAALTDSSVSAGKTIAVRIKVSQIKNLTNLGITLSYDTRSFELLSVVSNAETEYTDSNGNIGINVSGITADMNNTELVTASFKCLESAVSGTSEFALSSDTEGVFCTGCAVNIVVPNTAVIRADDCVGAYGETISVPVVIENNRGIMGYRLTFEYDSSAVEPVSVQRGEKFSGNYEDNIGLKDGTFDVLWSSSENVAENGTLLTLNFRVLTEEDTTSLINISFSQEDTFNEKYEDVVFECKDVSLILNRKIPEHTHEFTREVTKATLTENGTVITKCSGCGEVSSTETIYRPKTIELKANKFVCNGKAKTPAVNVVDSNGNTIIAENYTVKYNGARKNVGKYAVTIEFKGNYSGTKTLYFTIVPKGTKITKLKKAKNGFTVIWNKQKAQTTGYQIQYSTSNNFKTKKTITVKKNKTASKTVKKLKTKKKYYIRIRTYKTVNGTKYYSEWSKVKSIKVK